MLEKLRALAHVKQENSHCIEEKDKYAIIERILSDEKCFQKMETKVAYQLLEDLDFKSEEISQIYLELV